MKKRIAASAIGTLLGVLAGGAAAQGQTMAAPASPPIAPVAGWEDFIAGARDLPGAILARLPPRLRDDPQVRQEVARLALAAITTKAITAGEREHIVRERRSQFQLRPLW